MFFNLRLICVYEYIIIYIPSLNAYLRLNGVTKRWRPKIIQCRFVEAILLSWSMHGDPKGFRGIRGDLLSLILGFYEESVLPLLEAYNKSLI